MRENKIRVHGGRIVSPPEPSEAKTVPHHTSEEAVPAHQPGQTFHPENSKTNTESDIATSERTVSDLVHPQATKAGPELDLTTKPHKKPLSPEAKEEVAKATGMDQLVATPTETSPEPPKEEPVAETPKVEETVAAHEDKPQETYNYEPLKISKPKKSFGKAVLKTLLWVLISIVVVGAGAAAVIYFYKF